MILFGLTAEQAASLKGSGYDPRVYAKNSPAISGALRELNNGFCGIQFSDIADSLLKSDPYLVLADFASYEKARRKSSQLYSDPIAWQRMCLINVAKSGRFSADRAIREYAEKIWHAKPVPGFGPAGAESGEQPAQS